MLSSCIGVIELETSHGHELFFPVLCLFLGDMMELLIAARNKSANFSRLTMPCYICKKRGCELHDHQSGELRSCAENDRIIDSALSDLLAGKLSKARQSLREYSLLPTLVSELFACFFREHVFIASFFIVLSFLSFPCSYFARYAYFMRS